MLSVAEQKRIFGLKTKFSGPKKNIHFFTLTMFWRRPGKVVQTKKYPFSKFIHSLQCIGRSFPKGIGTLTTSYCAPPWFSDTFKKAGCNRVNNWLRYQIVSNDKIQITYWYWGEVPCPVRLRIFSLNLNQNYSSLISKIVNPWWCNCISILNFDF